MSSTLSNYSESDRELLTRASQWKSVSTCEELTVDALRQISIDEGVDFATAVLYDRLRHSGQHADFIKLMETESALPSITSPPLIAIVPSAFYAEYPETGGDGARMQQIARQLGWRCEMIPVASIGTLENNSLIIRDWLVRHADEPVLLVSICKGSSDVKMAFREIASSQSFNNVVAWINVCGTLRGAAISEWVHSRTSRRLLFRLMYRWQARDFQFLTDLRQSQGSALDFELPPYIASKLISVVGIPLYRHFSTPYARWCYRQIKSLGPNDGTILLGDVLRWDGLVFPVWGADHYLRPAHLDMDKFFQRLLFFTASRRQMEFVA